MKVYLVVEYGDSFVRVAAVFTTQAKAESFCPPGSGNFAIEGVELDPEDGQSVRPVWDGVVHLETGHFECHLDRPTYQILQNNEVISERGEPYSISRNGNPQEDVWLAICRSSVSPEHLKGLARDVRWDWVCPQEGGP